ncbi:MAG: AGE family epimerase/isomerase [Lautropia sp.]|nr:AGE family epimerase/isomerase [Lautropia sp.]
MITALYNPQHRRWLLEQSKALLEFARKAKVPFGFAYLDQHGEIDPDQPIHTWISCRMTHIYSIGTLMGVAGCRELAEHGVQALLEHIQDHAHGGFFEALALEPGPDGRAVPTETGGQKSAYAHAFVLLAASSGLLAGIARADELFERISRIIDQRFWDEKCGRMRESFSRDFSVCEPYRGMNANMHTVEACLAAFDAQRAQSAAKGGTGSPDAGLPVHGQDPDTGGRQTLRWLQRANSITHFAFMLAERNDYRLPEHFDEDWQTIRDYNEHDKAHPFRPYGATVGHALEWARLGAHVLRMNESQGLESPIDYTRIAFGLYRQALHNWHGDGAEGFVYTTDFDGNPIVRDRMHWVLCEAIGACVALDAITADDPPPGESGRAQGYVEAALGNEFSYWYEIFMAYAARHLIERAGRWTHQLDADNRPGSGVWSGRPDIYHAFQCLMLPLLPFGHSITAAVKAAVKADQNLCGS